MASTSSTASAYSYYVVFRLSASDPWQEDARFDTEAEAKLYVEAITAFTQQIMGEFQVWDDAKFSNHFGPPRAKEKGVSMDTLIYETEIGLGDGVMYDALIFTNAPNPGELTLYNRLAALRKDHHLIKAETLLKEETGRKFRIKHMGETYTLPFLIQHVARKGFEFRLEMLSLKTRDKVTNEVIPLINDVNEDKLIDRIRKSTRAWANSTSVNLLFVKGVTWKDFDSKLGMKTGNSRKQSKRENENSRVSELYFKGQKENFFFTDPTEGEAQKGVDGQMVVSRRAVQKAISNIPNKQRRHRLSKAVASWNIRALYEDGLLKGDAILAASDERLEELYGFVPDIVTDPCNLKEEKGMSDGYLVTLNAHHPHHQPNISAQALSWSGEFFVTEERLKKDFTAMTEEFKQSMEMGLFPEHLMNAAPVHDDEMALDEASYQEALHDSVRRFLATGLTLRHSSYLVDRLAQGFDKKLNRMIDRLAMPLPWATMAHCTTVTMLRMAGYDLSEYDTSKMFWHQPTGRMCWPTQDFIDAYARHGGHDLDDSHITMLRLQEVDPSDKVSLRFEAKGKVWCIKAINLRSPNGLTYFGPDELPGEYSVLDIDLGIKIVQCGFLALPVMNFPLYNVWNSIPAMFTEKAPKVTHHQLIEHEEMPRDDHELSDEYSVEDAIRQFKLAQVNPGIGSIINPLIAYSMMTGTYPESLPARLEEMVDALEQTPDMEAFSLIIEATKALQNQMMYGETASIDRHTAYTRLPKKVRNYLISKGRVEVGMMSRLAAHMGADTKALKLHLMGDTNRKIPLAGISIKNREAIPGMMDIEVTKEAMKVSYELHHMYWGKKKGAPQFRQYKDTATNRVMWEKDPYVSYARREFFIRLNNEMVHKLMEHENWDEILIGLYQLTIKENRPDNVLFQTGENDSLTGLMDYFIGAMFRNDIIKSMVTADNRVLVK